MKTCLIDDDVVFVFGMKRILQLTEVSDSVMEFPNGSEAIKFFSTSYQHEHLLPDVIFLDINMPIMDGWQFIEEFTKLKCLITKDINIYMISSSIDYEDAKRARSISEIKDFMVKPVTVEQVKELFSGICIN